MSIYESMSKELLENLRELKVKNMAELGQWMVAHPDQVQEGMSVMTIYSEDTTKIDAALARFDDSSRAPDFEGAGQNEPCYGCDQIDCICSTVGTELIDVPFLGRWTD